MAQIITINKNDELFPESFRAIGEDCPEKIYALGNLDLLKSEHMVAIIGSRKATRAGNSKAYELGLSYAKRGYVVVSGLALGCDAAAHRGGTMHTVRFAQKYGKKIKAAIFPYDKDENSGNKYIITTGIGSGI